MSRRQPHAVMSPRNAFWKWSLIGALGALALVVAQASAVGGLKGLLQVGESSDLRAVIGDELDGLPLAPDSGHDGQIFYAIGLDLTGQEVPELLDHPGYRYRRILFPALASGFGVFEGEALLVGMVVTVIVSSAVAAGSVAATARLLSRSDWIALVVVLNPGVWLSVRLLTSDVLAIALMSLGILGFMKRPRLGIAAFTLSVLAKEPYLMTPAGLSISRDRRRWLFTIAPVVVLVAIAAWVGLTISSRVTGETGNISLPFLGIVEASSAWGGLSIDDQGYLVFALASTAAALVLGLVHDNWLRWSILAWGVLGVCASAWVWRVGNNSARSVAPVMILVALGLAGGRIADPPTPSRVAPEATEDWTGR